LLSLSSATISRAFGAIPGNIYRFDLSYRNATSGPPATIAVVMNGVPNIITGGADWADYSTSVQAISSGGNIQITGVTNGMWLDSFTLRQVSGGNYYLPEESLSLFKGENALGNWQLEIWDSRAGAALNANLVSWQLQITFAPTNSIVTPLTNGICYTNLVLGSEIKYFVVEVPAAATVAANNLTSARDLILLGDRSGLPVGNSFTDDYFIDLNFGVGGEILLLTTNSPPSAPLQPGQRYYLGVKNANPFETNTFTLCVDFDRVDPTNLMVTPLTNMVAVTTNIAPGNVLQYFQFDVATNAISAMFEILNPSDDVDLVIRRGLPLPNPASFDYRSVNSGTNNELIVVTTNSSPIPLAPGRWYLGVYSSATNPVTYTIRVTEQFAGTPGPTNIIDLINGVATNYFASPGSALTNFFRFVINQTNASALFELYNLTGNADLLLRRGALPTATTFDFVSQNPGSNGEQIVLTTNGFLPDLNGEWFLGVPNNGAFTVNFTIRAIVSTNGVLVSGQPPNFIGSPVVTLDNKLRFTWNSVLGQRYEVQASADLITWTVLDTVTAAGPITTYTTVDPIGSFPYRFFRLRQVP
ncbi:MAG: pre-peptidase C-terminal domain-containing protein, partial [Limisphaerales bacterium]